MLQITVNDMFSFRLIDGLIKEPIGGAYRDLPTAAVLIKESILHHLEKLSSKSIETLLQERTEKYKFKAMKKK